MDKQTLLNGFRLNIDYTLALVEDVAEEHMTAQPGGFANHPAFTLGHLVSATALTAEDLGHPYEVPEGWDELFRRRGPGDPRRPTTEAERLPTKDELVVELKAKADLVVRLVQEADDEFLEQTLEWKLDQYMPTVGQVVTFQCLLHHGWHIGQLAEWRRLMGYDSALAKLV